MHLGARGLRLTTRLFVFFLLLELPPLPIGMLTMNELKIQNGLAYLNDETVVGIAMSAEDLVSLRDVYDEVQQGASRTSHVMQFLWRDYSGNFDVIGPYFTSEGGLGGHAVFAALWDTVAWLARHGFQTHSVCSDAASTNVKAFDAMVDDLVDTPFVHNPFSGKPLYFFPDPPHMLKSIRNAWYHSREGRHSQTAREKEKAKKKAAKTGKDPDKIRNPWRHMHLRGKPITWEVLVDALAREEERGQDTGSGRNASQLKKECIELDNWSKMKMCFPSRCGQKSSPSLTSTAPRLLWSS